jgi:predicted nucleic acid-binding protein
VIYVDTSVLLAALIAEDRRPPASFWSEALATSRLADYEVWVRIHARGVAERCGEEATRLLGRLRHLELQPPVLDRLREPLPVPVRTLDAIHLVSARFLAEQLPGTRIATYDHRLARAASAFDLHAFEP